ncbi:MAG: hypothetical protein A2X88_03745 [Deltaproteobacteria bacterium GWC2_65_14]|nr:MAG: hypothetical protein A2X88_03745 [Deltaproteobacteria bacterium GWC2_65_14]
MRNHGSLEEFHPVVSDTPDQEAAQLRERLKLEERAHDLERSLGYALAKVLSGFIRICANCKTRRII